MRPSRSARTGPRPVASFQETRAGSAAGEPRTALIARDLMSSDADRVASINSRRKAASLALRAAVSARRKNDRTKDDDDR
ncbi:hypothetical protein ABGB18_28640 [Nonomuraea sp. B12E4]|uniref:hypothetical protein n=1 Tax=Nonomuraea sp. B12E4 TaxID=3153564 RepID=UPI00325D0798